ncbi:MAG: TonB-dependent receptor [Colwellia sp.]|nr:TonB-dependent receptor [Colwellia sp.]
MITNKFTKSKVATSLSFILGATALPAISAEEVNNQATEQEIEVIQVSGIRGSSKASINTKRFASSQVDGISAEDIGKLPDVTITDSLQRISGVQIERVAGEGGPVQIRGLAQIDTTMNGEVFLSATTIDSSGADLGDLPAQLFSGVDVYKSASSTNVAAGIAGSIDLKTRRPFQLEPGFTFSGGAEATQGSISKKTDPLLNGLIGYNADKWGVVISAVTSEVNLATDYNGHNDTSENGGIGWTSNNFAWGGTPTDGSTTRNIVPHGFTAFNKTEERKRDALQLSFQAELGDGFELTAEYFYTQQDRFNARRGFNHNMRWQTYNNYAFATGTTGDTFNDADGNAWQGVNAFEMNPYRMQTFTQANVNEENSQNFNLELNFDNGGALTGQVRATTARATAKMRHAYAEGDILSIDQGSLVTGPGWLTPAEYCNNGEEIIGDQGGCNGTYSQGIEDDSFLITHDASGEYPVFGGFDQMVGGGKGQMSIADYMADLDSYHIGAFSSEGNTDDKSEISTFSTKWNYEFDDGFVTSVDFGLRLSQRTVDHDQFTYTSDFGGGCDIAQWKAVDQQYNGAPAIEAVPADGDTDAIAAAAAGPCFEVEGTGEHVDGVWTPYTLLNPTRLDQYTSVSWQTNFGNVGGIPGMWSIDPSNFRDPRAFHEKTFGNVARTENGGATYNVGLDEITYFVQANFEWEELTGNFGMKVVETDLTVKQNLVGPNLPHSGLGPDIGDVITERSYTDYLPSLNLAYSVSQDVVLRAAWSKNMQALNMDQWGAGKTVGTVFDNDCGCMRVVNGTLNGNPELDPWRSENFSLTAEWYTGDASMAYVATYGIDIESFTESDTIMIDEPDSDGVSRGPHPFTANVQGNGGDVSGYEIGAKVAISDFLGTDSIFANFGVDANYTFSESSQDAKDIHGDDLPFVGMSEDTYNFVLWYENETFSARMAYNARSPRLITAGGGATGGQSLYQDDYAQLDVNVTYNFDENISLYINGSNITEEYQQTYVEFSEQKAFQNVYEARWTLGARVIF